MLGCPSSTRAAAVPHPRGIDEAVFGWYDDTCFVRSLPLSTLDRIGEYTGLVELTCSDLVVKCTVI